MHQSKAIMLLTLIAGMAFCANCARVVENLKPSGGSNIIGSPEDVALTKKLDPFIQCLNSVDGNIHQKYDEYLAADVPNRKTADGDFPMFNAFRLVPHQAANEGIKKCQDGVEQGVNLAPELEDLDAEGREYVASLGALSPLMDEADSYYRQKNYKDDAYAKGKQMHGPLVAAFDQYVKSAEKIRALVEKQDEGLKTRQLAEIERQQGRKLNYLTNNMMLHARRVFVAGNVEQPNAEALRPEIAAFDAAYEEAKRYANEHPDELRTGGTQPNFVAQQWNLSRPSAEFFLTAAKELERGLKSDPDARKQQYALENFVRTYNQLITTYNLALPRV